MTGTSGVQVVFCWKFCRWKQVLTTKSGKDLFLRVDGCHFGIRLCNIQHMIADSFKVGEHFGVQNAAFFGALSPPHTGDMIVPIGDGHIVDALLQRGNGCRPDFPSRRSSFAYRKGTERDRQAVPTQW